MTVLGLRHRHPPIACSASSFTGREREYVLDCLNRNWLSQGYYVRQLEERFAEFCGVRHAIACSSGTAALHLIMLGLGVGPQDAVIVPALTYVATANAARYCGAQVCFSDINESDWCIDAYDCADVTNDLLWWGECRKIIAVPVHLYDAVWSSDFLHEQTDIFDSVDDACHAIGAKDTFGSTVGSLFRAAAFSFYGSKSLSCGEGGMVTTDDDELTSTVRLYRGQGATIPGQYHHSVIGCNYRMTDLQAAVGLGQLESLPQNLVRRREVVDRYRANLFDSPITLQGGERASGWSCAVLVPEEYGSSQPVRDVLAGHGIETRPFFEPLPGLPIYKGDSQSSFPVAESVSRRGICLPTHTLLTDDDVDYVCERLLEAVR